MEIFTLSHAAKPKAIFVLPTKVCNKNAANFLLQKLINPLLLELKDYAFASAFVPEKGKLKKDIFEDEAASLIEYCEMYEIKTIAVGNADYYQGMTGDKKMLLNIGRSLPGIKMFEGYSIVPILNPVILNMFPERSKELNRGLSALQDAINGEYSDPVETLSLDLNVILTNPKEIYSHLKNWIDEPELIVDIETTGLRWYADRLLTMSFSRNEKEAFCIAIHPKYHNNDNYREIVKIMKAFFTQYKGEFVGHNFIAFDLPFLVHEVMRGFDFSVRHEPLINCFKIRDSMLLAYVLYNSTERISIGLKELSYSFMGDYASDIDQKDLFNADLYKVGTYNNYDVIANYRVWHKLLKEVDSQMLPVFEEINDIGMSLLKMKMNGLRIAKDKVGEAIEELNAMVSEKKVEFRDHSKVRQAEKMLAAKRFKKYNETLVNKKQWTPEVAEKWTEPFNLGSPSQKQFLLIDLLGLPVVKTSKDTKLPSTDKEAIDEWLSMSLPKDQENLLNLLREISDAEKVLSTYLKVFIESSVEVSPNHWKVFSNFNQTGTISGRLSSSGGLNMQNLPSNSAYGVLVKKLLIPDEGNLILTADFNALEERVICVLSNDQAKLRTFTAGVDSHSLHASIYYQEELESRGLIIDRDDVNSINRIKKEAPDLRQAGKSVTFGLNYLAGPKKVASQLNISPIKGQEIYDLYWSVYSGIHKFNLDTIAKAKEDGYLISPFSGLKVTLASINAKDSYIQQKEERVACNFMSQGGNFLTLRALHKLQQKAEVEMLGRVFIYLTVHDSIYLQGENSPEVVKWVNDNLIQEMSRPVFDNQILDFSAELDVGTSHKELTTLKNGASLEEISEVLASL